MQLVHDSFQVVHGRKKMLYDKKVHEKMFEVGDLVFLNSAAVPEGSLGNCLALGKGLSRWKREGVSVSIRFDVLHFDLIG